jgi:putative peptidoglycan binding protein
VKFKLINCKPVPAKLYHELVAMGFGRDITLNSCDRSQAGVNFARGQGCSLSSQAELFNGFIRGLPGFNPANPPGRSTHERRNDGVAYVGPAGMPLRYWQVGIDCSNAPLACARARERGWIATLTYPGNPREGHHINFRREPKLRIFRPLKKGSGGRRVKQLTARLAYLGYLDKATGGFGDKVEEALRRFQHDTHAAVDGIYGIHTHKQLLQDVRGRKRCRKAAMKIRDRERRERALRKCNRRFGPARR